MTFENVNHVPQKFGNIDSCDRRVGKLRCTMHAGKESIPQQRLHVQDRYFVLITQFSSLNHQSGSKGIFFRGKVLFEVNLFNLDGKGWTI